jgi:hypothetical protein
MQHCGTETLSDVEFSSQERPPQAAALKPLKAIDNMRFVTA